MIIEPVREVTIGLELRVTTAQLMDDMAALTEIRQIVSMLADKLMREAPGAKEVTTTWSVDRVVPATVTGPTTGEESP